MARTDPALAKLPVAADVKRPAATGVTPKAPRSIILRFARSPTLLSVLLFLVVLVAFGPVLSSGFIDLDDDLYITANRQVRAGVTPEGIQWALTSTTASNWHPVTWLAHMLDCQIYGLRPWGHHLSSVLIHDLNTVLLLLILWRLTSSLWPSLLVAGLFGLHPLHMESVAWAAERKDVLSTLFLLLTIWTYSRYANRSAQPSQFSSRKSQTRGANPKVELKRAGEARVDRVGGVAVWYSLALVLYALGLMTKPMLVSLPFILLLLDWWPLRRSESLRSLPKLLLEKIPFIVLSAASCVITYIVQQRSGALAEMGKLRFPARLENALVSYGRYLGKTFWPSDLTLFYPFPDHWPVWLVILAAGVLVGLSALAVRWRRRYPWFLVGWAWFVITLLPVIGLVQAGGQAMADRYTYIPSIGIFIVLAWFLQACRSNPRVSTPATGTGYFGRALTLLPVPVIVLCAVLTYHQANYWRTSETLWSHALAVARNNFLAHINLGLELQRQNRLEEAAGQFRAAVRLRPAEAKAHANLGNVLCRQEHVAEGISEFETAIRLNPNSAGARHNLAIAYCRQGRFQEGIEQFETVLKLRPDSAQAHFDLAMALVAGGRKPEAIPHVEHALQLRPSFTEARQLLRTLKEAGSAP